MTPASQLGLWTGMLMLSASLLNAASIGLSFLGDGETGTDDWRLAPGDEAGVVAQRHWNNVNTTASGNVGTADSLLDDLGNFTAVQLGYNANDAWNSDGFNTSPNEKLMKGILKQGGVASSMTLTFTNLSPAPYDIYVYGNVNGGPVDLGLSLGGHTNFWHEFAEFDDVAGFLDAADPISGGFGDYVRFTGVNPVDGGITVTATYLAGSDGLGISGLQIVSATGFPSNAAPVVISRQPQPALAAPGGAATFAVQVTGPFPSYQWFKNDAPIDGATSARYTTPSLTSAEDGAKYKVTITNNVNSVTSDEATLTIMNDPGTRVASIGANFLGDGDDPEYGRLNLSEEAGVVPQTNWNNIVTTGWGSGEAPSGGAISDPMLDSAGNLTVVQLLFDANDSWNSDGLTNSPNEKLMKGILKENGIGSSLTLTFTNLASAFYDLYVYGNVNGGPVDMDVSIDALTNYWSAPAAFDPSSGFIEVASSDPDARAEGNYVKFTGVTPVSGGITVTATYIGGSDGAAIAGLQIISSTAFPTSLPTQLELTARREGNEIVVTWDSPLFQLQYQDDLGSGDWSDETTPPEVSGNQVTVRVPAGRPARFYRLRSGSTP